MTNDSLRSCSPSVEPALPSKKPRKCGRESSLTEEPEGKLFKTYLPDWEELLRKHNLDLGKVQGHSRLDPSAISEWVGAAVQGMIKCDEFRNTKGNDEKAWKASMTKVCLCTSRKASSDGATLDS